MPGFPKASNELGFTGSRYHGPPRGFSVEGAASYPGHVAVTSGHPFSSKIGFRIISEDVREAVPRISCFRESQLAKLESIAQLLSSRINSIRDEISTDNFAMRAGLQISLLEDLPNVYGIGEMKWRGQLADGFPMLSDLAPRKLRG